MVDETDVRPELKWLGEEQARLVVANLERKNISAWYFPDRKEAREFILSLIPPGVVVARGDSMSMEQVGVVEELIKRGQNKFLDPFKRDEQGNWFYPLEERERLERETFFADIFLVGANAITLDGKLVNVDGHGNRVAALIFGPRKVIVAAGVNKIVPDEEAARERIRRICAPVNARRHYTKHHREDYKDLPCVLTGRCANCNHPWRLCRYTMIVEGTMLREKGRINVVLVGEELGI
ncbi:MAG: lactate utilization protein [Chloroflexota bacterium]